MRTSVFANACSSLPRRATTTFVIEMKEGDFRIISMDDETIYGPRAYTLTFGSAAQQGIICNYKVVISVVAVLLINNYALKPGIRLVKRDLIRDRWVANQIASEGALEKTARQ